MFELYQPKEKACPSRVEIDGDSVEINADFRNIIKILAVLKDKKIPQHMRVEKLIQWFFTDFQDIEPEVAIKAFNNFISPKQKNEQPTLEQHYGEDLDEQGSQFDYYYDSEEIYASFMSEYGINILRIDFLHWYEFNYLLKNLSGESAFKKKIELRFMDLSVYSRDNQALARMSKAKESVQLPIEYSEEELRKMEKFDSVWGRM